MSAMMTTTTTMSDGLAVQTPNPSPLPYKPSSDALFRYIESLHQSSPTDLPSLGSVLDAGTGSHSLRWLCSLEKQGCLTNWTAVTADAGMLQSVKKELSKVHPSSEGGLVLGNWASSSDLVQAPPSTHLAHNTGEILTGKTYDTILADYLLGAMDGFSPYYQDLLLPRLSSRLSPSGLLHVAGLSPIPDSLPSPSSNLICEIRRVRDACILLAGHRCYREYPSDWVVRQAAPGLTVEAVKSFPILWSEETAMRQVNVGRSKLGLMSEEARGGMEGEIGRLERRVREELGGGGGSRWGRTTSSRSARRRSRERTTHTHTRTHPAQGA